METTEKIEKIEKIEKSGIEEEKNCFVRIIENKEDHVAIHDTSQCLNAYKNTFIFLKDSLVSVRESGNISVRETQKVLTTLCKTIHSIDNFENFLKETAYNTEHASEINAEKRALREMIKSASPEDMAEFRAFLKEKNATVNPSEETPKEETPKEETPKRGNPKRNPKRKIIF